MIKKILSKTLLTLGICTLTTSAWGYGIVDRTATRDTLAIPFQILDSLGSPVDDATGDSVFIVITSPGGVEVHSDSMLFTDGRIIEYLWEDYGNAYTYMDRVSDLDGSSTSDGVFSYMLLIHDQSLGLQTPYRGTFQIINEEFETILDSIGLAAVDAQAILDSIQVYDNATRFQADIQEILDSIQVYDNAGRFQADIQAVLDSINLYDNAGRFQADVQEILDTLQTYDDATRFQAEVVAIFSTLAPQKGIVTLASDGTKFTAAALTQGNDYWIDQVVFMRNGTASGQVARITKFVAAQDSLIFTPAMSATPAAGDSFYIMNQFFEAATATLSDADMGAIGDTVWDKAKSDGTAIVDGMGDFLRDTSNSVLAEVLNIDAWNPVTDNDSLIIDQSTLTALKPTTAGRTLDVTAAGEAGIDLDNTVGTISAAEIATDAIGAAEIAANAIGASELAADAIGASEIGTAAIDADAIATDAIGALEIAADAIGASEIATDAIGALEIATDAITAAEIAASAIGSSELATDAITSDEISATGAAEIADTVWAADTLAHNATVGSFGEFLYKPQTASLTDADMGAIGDTVWDKAKADMFAVSEGAGDFLRDTLLAIIDTLQNHDNWVGTSSNQTLIIDTVNGIIDTLQNFPARVDLLWDEDSTGHYTSPNMAFVASQTGVSATDTANILTALANNPQIASGFQVTWMGTVDDNAGADNASAFGVKSSGSGADIDLTRGDDYYLDHKLLFITGGLKGTAQPILDWITATDSIEVRTFFAAPTVNDSFVIISQYFPDVFSVHNTLLTGAVGANWKADYDGTGYDKANSTIGTATNLTNDPTWSTAQRDSLLAALADASIGDKVWTDGAFANRFTTVEQDSVIAALADVNIGDKVWTDGSHTTRDSIIAALADVNIGDKVWVDKALADREVDVKSISDDALADDSLEAWLDGYADGQLTNREHLFTNLDEILSTRSKIGDTSIGGDERDLVINATRDTVNALLDTLQLWDTRIDSLEAALADANINDKVWVDGAGVKRDAIIDTANAILDTLQALAMDNIKEAFDGDVIGAPMVLTRLHVHAAAGDTAVVMIGGTTEPGLLIRGGPTSGLGVNIIGGAPNGIGLQVSGTGTGRGADIGGGLTNADGLRLTATGTGIDLNAPDFAGIVGDSILDKDTLDAFNIAGGFGKFIKDSTQGAAGGITDAQMGAIADSVHDKDTLDAFAIAGGFGKFVKDSTQGAAGSLDSQIVSNIMHRVGWGTPRGSGSDSSTIAERDATAAGTVTDADITNIMDSLGIRYMYPFMARNQMFGPANSTDSQYLVRYISLDGDNSDGLTPQTAWTSPNSLTGFTSTLKTNGFNGQVDVFLAADSFFNVYCSLQTVSGAQDFSLNWFGSGWDTWVQGKTTYGGGAGDASEDSNVVVISGNGVFFYNTAFCGFDTVGDPEPGAGVNALQFDSTADYGGIIGCLFPGSIDKTLNHKPIVIISNAQAQGEGKGFIIRDNMAYYPKKHWLDANIGGSLIENNTIIGSYTHFDGSAAIQLIGDVPNDVRGHRNVVKGNYFIDVAIGIALINSDSNLIIDNYFGKVDEPWTVTAGGGYPTNAFVDNHFLGDNQKTEGYIINSGFEITEWAPGVGVGGWFGNNNDMTVSGQGGLSRQHGAQSYNGEWSWYLQPDTTAETAYLTTGALYLTPGTYYTHFYWRPNNGNQDSLVIIVTDEAGAGADTALTGGTDTVVTTLGTNWTPYGKTFTIVASGEYYIAWEARGDQDDAEANEFFIDDVSLYRIGPSFAGDGSGIVFFATTDTSGTDTLVSGVPVTIRDLPGNQIGESRTTNSAGYTSFNLNIGDSFTVEVVGNLHNQHVWSNSIDTFVPSAAYDTFAIGSPTAVDSVLGGYDRTITSPGSGNLCTVYGDIYDLGGTDVKDVVVTVTADFGNAIDTVASRHIWRKPKTTASDSVGHWEIILLRSSQTKPKATYVFSAKKGKGPNAVVFKSAKVIVPDSTTFRLQW